MTSQSILEFIVTPPFCELSSLKTCSGLVWLSENSRNNHCGGENSEHCKPREPPMRPVPAIKVGDKAKNGGFVGVFTSFHWIFLLKMYCKGHWIDLIALNLWKSIVNIRIYIFNFFLFSYFQTYHNESDIRKKLKNFDQKKFFHTFKYFPIKKGRGFLWPLP